LHPNFGNTTFCYFVKSNGALLMLLKGLKMPQGHCGRQETCEVVVCFLDQNSSQTNDIR